MKKELEDYYFQLAAELAHAELMVMAEEDERASAERMKLCLGPVRARAIALGAEATPGELEHTSACNICARFVNNYRPEPLPASALLVAKLKWYCGAPDRILLGMVEKAKSNASSLLPDHGMKQKYAYCAPGEETYPRAPASFRQGSLSIHLNRREGGGLVVDLTSEDETLCGRDLPVALVGEGGREVRVVVRLLQRGRVCGGSTAVGSPDDEILEKLGPVIVPVVPDGRGTASLDG
jgi:hypothetical protein